MSLPGSNTKCHLLRNNAETYTYAQDFSEGEGEEINIYNVCWKLFIPNKVFRVEKRIQYMELIVFDMKGSPFASFLSLVLEEIVS